MPKETVYAINNVRLSVIGGEVNAIATLRDSANPREIRYVQSHTGVKLGEGEPAARNRALLELFNVLAQNCLLTWTGGELDTAPRSVAPPMQAPEPAPLPTKVPVPA